MRKSNGNLHYFINGLDQGIAAPKIPQYVWGVIDLYGMTIKVSNEYYNNILCSAFFILKLSYFKRVLCLLNFVYLIYIFACDGMFRNSSTSFCSHNVFDFFIYL